jgi:hypothetical protein
MWRPFEAESCPLSHLALSSGDRLAASALRLSALRFFALLCSSPGESSDSVGTTLAAESQDPDAWGGAPSGGESPVEVAFGRGTALRISLGALAMAVGADGGRRGVVDSVEDVDTLLLFLPLGEGRGDVGLGVIGLPPVASPDDVDASAASEAVGWILASNATRAAMRPLARPSTP